MDVVSNRVKLDSPDFDTPIVAGNFKKIPVFGVHETKSVSGDFFHVCGYWMSCLKS